MEEWCWALTRLLPVPAGAAPSGVGPPAPGGPPRGKAPPAGGFPGHGGPVTCSSATPKVGAFAAAPRASCGGPFPYGPVVRPSSSFGWCETFWVHRVRLQRGSPRSFVRLCWGETASWRRVQQRVVSQIWWVLLRPCCSTNHINKVIRVRKQA